MEQRVQITLFTFPKLGLLYIIYKLSLWKPIPPSRVHIIVVVVIIVVIIIVIIVVVVVVVIDIDNVNNI